MVNNGNFKFLAGRAHIDRSTGRYTTPVEAPSGQEWQHEISTVSASIGRSTGKSSPQ